jgi:serine/threonine protein kinase
MQVQCRPCVAGKYAGQEKAVKLLTAASLTAQVKLFMRNKVVMSGLIGPHLHIVPVHDVLKSGKGVGGIAMPVCGDNLAQVASTAFSAYMGMCHQVALGIEHMHSKEVVHLDIKETNVLLGRDGQLLIADFGLSAREGAKLQLARGNSGLHSP